MRTIPTQNINISLPSKSPFDRLLRYIILTCDHVLPEVVNSANDENMTIENDGDLVNGDVTSAKSAANDIKQEHGYR